VLAHSIEGQIYQRLGPWFYLRANYRVHYQNGVDFFSIRAAPDATLRTADSDLAAFTSQTVGILGAVDIPFARRIRSLHADIGYERYFRSNDLRVNMYTCSVGFLF
jgi:hypothetical protein